MFGCDTFGIRPDIMTVAKALSASYLPISATLISGRINDALVGQSRKLGAFMHGFTYAGHPVSAAVAVEPLRIYEERDIVGVVQQIAPYFQDRLRALAAHPLVGETRGVGLLGAVQLTADRATRAPLPAEAGLGPPIMENLAARGVLLRATPEAVYLCPPLIISRAEVDELIGAVAGALDHALDHARRTGVLASAPARAAE
jgi:4-aminobutyrate--pyruvate transaminase